MAVQRITLEVTVDMDPFGGGAFSTPESAKVYLQRILDAQVSHWQPEVAVKPEPGPKMSKRKMV